MGNNGSVAGATKQIVCSVCGDVFTGSLYSNPKTARCPKCKKVSAKVGVDKSIISDASKPMLPVDTKPVKIQLVRNRQDVEGEVIMDTGEIFTRIPTSWKIVQNELDYLSVSKMSTYQQCPGKFYNQYMNHTSGKDDDGGNIFTWFGSIMHEVMEISHKMHMSGLMPNVVQLFDEAWRKRELTDLSMYKEGRGLVLEYFRVHPVGSEPFKIIATEIEWRGTLGDFIDNCPPDIASMPFGNQFDLIAEIDPETALIKDYKTNRHPYTQYDLEDSLQLATYELIARKLYPQYKKWITGYELFRFGWQQCPQRSQEDLEATGSFIVNIAYQIKNDNIWKSRLNTFCGYCSGRYKCEEYCDFVNNPKRKIDTLQHDNTDLASIESDREAVGTYLKILEGRKDELSKIVKTAIEQSAMKGEKLVVDGNELYLQAQSRPSYNYFAARDVLTIAGRSDILDQCVSISKAKLDKLVKDNPQLAIELTRCQEQGYSAPYLLKRKAKGAK